MPVKEGRSNGIVVPESAADQHPGGGLVIETHSRLFTYRTPDGEIENIRALTVFLVNRRNTVHRFYSDVSFIFQARLELKCDEGFWPRRDLSGVSSEDWDLRVADLHYRDVSEWAVGRNAAASWEETENLEGKVTRVWTDPMPTAEVERVAPNEDDDLKAAVTFGMETLADAANSSGADLFDALSELPKQYEEWIQKERGKLSALPPHRRSTADLLIQEMTIAKGRISAGIELVRTDAKSREAFRFMNLAVASAARRRIAGPFVSFRRHSVLIYKDRSSGPGKTRVRGASCRERLPRPSNGRFCRRFLRQSLKLASGVDESALPKALSTGSEWNARELMPLWAHEHLFVSQVDSEKPHI